MARAKIASDSSHLDQLVMEFDGDAAVRDRLRPGGDWSRRWIGAGEMCWPIRDMAHVPVLSSRPMRGFTWRAKQRLRPGGEVVASMDWAHGSALRPNPCIEELVRLGVITISASSRR